jgi:hypothetical protein
VTGSPSVRERASQRRRLRPRAPPKKMAMSHAAPGVAIAVGESVHGQKIHHRRGDSDRPPSHPVRLHPRGRALSADVAVDPHEANLRRARAHLVRIKARIEAGTFCFAEEFPDYRGVHHIPMPLRAQACSAVFDAFLRHGAARVARGELAPITLASHRQILDHVWRPALGRLPFLSLRHSLLVQIADAQPWNKKTITTR